MMTNPKQKPKDACAKDSWQPEIISYNAFQMVMARYDFASQFVKSKVVLDVACGSGYGSNHLTKKGAEEVVGGDVFYEAIKYGTTHYRQKGSYFLCLDAQKLPFRDDSFDVIVSSETIEHLQECEDFLDECRRILRDDGLFFSSTPNKTVFSPYSKKPIIHEHVKEFYVEEFRYLLSKYFKEVIIYGLFPQSKKRAMVYTFGLWIKIRISKFFFSIPSSKRRKIQELITKFIFHRYQPLDSKKWVQWSILNAREIDKPFLLLKNSPIPLIIVAVCRGFRYQRLGLLNWIRHYHK